MGLADLIRYQSNISHISTSGNVKYIIYWYFSYSSFFGIYEHGADKFQFCNQQSSTFIYLHEGEANRINIYIYLNLLLNHLYYNK